MNTSILTTLALLVTSLATAFVVTGGEAEWTDGAGVMMASGHLILTAVTIVAALVGAARWSVWLGVGLAAFVAIPGVAQPIDSAWIVMVVAGGLALAGLLGTGLRPVVRQRPPADAPPAKATALALGMLAAPVLVGMLQPGGVDAADWGVAAASLFLAGWYTRARPSALWATRAGLPLLTVVSGFAIPFPQASAAILGFGALTWLAWTSDARVAAIPLASPGRSVPIPPELAPGEILDAAGLDSRGHRKEGR